MHDDALPDNSKANGSSVPLKASVAKTAVQKGNSSGATASSNQLTTKDSDLPAGGKGKKMMSNTPNESDFAKTASPSSLSSEVTGNKYDQGHKQSKRKATFFSPPKTHPKALEQKCATANGMPLPPNLPSKLKVSETILKKIS